MGIDELQPNGTSVILLERFRDGDELAAEALFSRYFERLTRLARRRLSARLASRTDPEDIVMSVYRSFFKGARAGRFSLGRGGDLWSLLASITNHKLLRQVRHHSADCRSVEVELSLEHAMAGRSPVQRREPSAEEAVALADELEWVFSNMDVFGRRVLELRLQGSQLSEIAQEVGRSERTVRRALAHARELLCERFQPSDSKIRDDVGQLDGKVGRRSNDSRSRTIVREEPSLIPVQFPSDQTGLSPLFSHNDVLLKRMIGAGQMGKVYQASLRSVGRTVAVKFLRKSLLRQPGVIQRFIDEARTVARLDHPRLVGVHGLGQAPGGAYFIVMDFIDGPNLADLAKIRSLSVNESVKWAIETCSAIEHAHAMGIIHCDLKPANLLLGPDGSIRVTDFGLARSLTGQAPWAAEVEGTAPFMAPEQAARHWGTIGVHTDIYGVGAVLYTLLTGRPPWPGRRLPNILADVICARPVIAPISLCPDIPQLLNDICRKCLCKAPADRYATVRDLLLALSDLFGELS
jgi:RNA polymerase sigma factor (sigma-70 family)